MQRYIVAQTVLTILVLFFTLLFEHWQTPTQLGVAAFFILTSAINTGAMLEQRTWIFELDFLRATLVMSYLYLIFPYAEVAFAMLLVLSGLVLGYLSLRERYYQLLYA